MRRRRDGTRTGLDGTGRDKDGTGRDKDGTTGGSGDGSPPANHGEVWEG